jgi:hypothetical protein
VQLFLYDCERVSILRRERRASRASIVSHQLHLTVGGLRYEQRICKVETTFLFSVDLSFFLPSNLFGIKGSAQHSPMLAPYPVPMVRRGSTGRGTGSRAPSNTPAENSKMPARTTVWFTFGCFGMRGAMSPGEGGSGREEASLSPGPAHTSSNLWQSSHSTHAVEREGSTSLQYTNCGILGPSGTDTAVMLVRDYCP